MKKITIEKCTIEDIESIRNLAVKTFCETFSEINSDENMKKYIKNEFSYEKLKNEIKNEYSMFYTAKFQDEKVAYMKVNFEGAQTEKKYCNTLEVQRIYVLKDYKRNHIGSILLKKAIEIAKENNFEYIWLGVWEDNIDAIKFYERFGFIKFDSHIFRLGDDQQIDNLMKLIL